jgi:hypothetical protein
MYPCTPYWEERNEPPVNPKQISLDNLRNHANNFCTSNLVPDLNALVQIRSIAPLICEVYCPVPSFVGHV